MKRQSMRMRDITKDWPVGDGPARLDPIWLFGGLGVCVGIGLVVFIVNSIWDSGNLLPQPITQPPFTPMMVALPPALEPTPIGAAAIVSNAVENRPPTEESKKITRVYYSPDPSRPTALAPIKNPQQGPPATIVAPPRKSVSEVELIGQLRDMPEFGLKAAVRDSLVETYKANYQSNAAMGRRPTFDASLLLKHMPAAQQLSVRTFPSCQLHPFVAVSLGNHSRALRAYLEALAPKDATGKRSDPKQLRTTLRKERRGKPPAWLHPDAIPAMVQILGAEDVPLRLILVDMLADIRGQLASIRLAQRAVFDVSPQVRAAAIDALRERPSREARRTLVDAMQHPWPAAADHAANALVARGDRDAAPLLVAMLDKPNPIAPVTTKTGAYVRELVRVNHVQNCLLCHVPAVGRDPVTDVDPFAARPTQTYQVGSYSGPKLPGAAGTGAWTNKVLIRADVQFFRQDFSVTFPTGNNADSRQRFDFLVRNRPVPPEELQRAKEHTRVLDASYPQRESVLYALRQLTGQDVGPSTNAWVKLFPNARAEAEGVRIASTLKVGLQEQRDQQLARYRDAKESHFTEGLAHAIPHVSPKMQDKVRLALVERLVRLPADELKDYLEDEGELRLAAHRACIRKADPTFIPELINLLADEGDLANSALQALKKMTNEDFGPPVRCSPAEREDAIAKWQAWYFQQGAK